MSSPTASQATPVPGQGHVRLILLNGENLGSSFYMDIPINIIQDLCLRPLKYILYLGWCILGVEGVLASEPDGEGIDTDGDLEGRNIYYYVRPEDADLSKVVDLEVIKGRTHVPSETTRTCEDFREKLLERDPCCVFTGVDKEDGIEMHIIPHRRGSEWLQLIVNNRPSYSEDVTTLSDINDIRNGLFAMEQIHLAFDPRRVAILKTPNHILNMTDVPPRHNQPDMPASVKYPLQARYTLQWLVPTTLHMRTTIPNNIDAAFKKFSRKPKPSDLLLHYNYGAAAVKRWGHGTDLLENLTNRHRPSTPVPAPMEVTKTTHDRSIAIAKRDEARDGGGAGVGNTTAGAGAGAGAGGAGASDGRVLWDEDDVMLFCWGNSRAAKERHQSNVKETTQRMEGWRAGVLQGLA